MTLPEWMLHPEIAHPFHQKARFPWMMDFMRDVWVGPRSPLWWRLMAWRLCLGPYYRTLVLAGVWEVGEGSYYSSGHWAWRTERGKAYREHFHWTEFPRYILLGSFQKRTAA